MYACVCATAAVCKGGVVRRPAATLGFNFSTFNSTLIFFKFCSP